MDGRWLVSGVAPPAVTTGGGLLRSRRIFEALVRRTGAEVVGRSGGRAVVTTLARRPWLLRSQLAAAQILTPKAWSTIRRLVRPAVLDLYDHPVRVLHLEKHSGTPTDAHRRQLEEATTDMLERFRHVVVQTVSFADLSDVPEDRRLVIPNGTDTTTIQPGPLPTDPVVGLVSGAAASRGIEQLLDAMKLVRSEIPDARVRLALAAMGPASKRYLDDLRRTGAALGWVEIEDVPYPRLAAFMAGTTVLAVTHGPDAYWDAILPLKLFDSMAAARPVVATPRTETARVLREHDAGEIAASDTNEDLASAIVALLRDPRRAQRLGANGRRAAVEVFDWSVLSERLAEAVLGGPDPRRPG